MRLALQFDTFIFLPQLIMLYGSYRHFTISTDPTPPAMTDLQSTENEPEPASGISTRTSPAEVGVLLLILLLALFLRAWDIAKEGSGNAYYYAAVRSMLVSPMNFFSGSFDPIGIVTVDKPPLALWLQALSAKQFGFNTPAVMLPQALLGVLNVLLTFMLVRLGFSSRASLLAAFVMAIMPIAVAMDRLNMPDTLLLTTVLLSALALLRSCRDGSAAALAESMLFLGLGFTAKMLAAWVVVPAWFAVWWKSTPVTGAKKLGQTALAGIVLIVASLAWAFAFDMIPAQSRPYAGGSTNNSMMQLALGYNGLGRIFGGMGNMPGGRPGGPGGPGGPDRKDFSKKDERPRTKEFAKSGGPPFGPGGGPPGGRGPGGPMGFFFGGPIGPWRFIWPTMAGLAFWLTPFAVRAIPGWRLLKAPRLNETQAVRAILAGWFVMWGLVLCLSNGIMHPYYSIMISPALAGLAGITLDQLLASGWPTGRRGVAFFAVALLWQLITMAYSPEWRLFLVPAIGLALGASYYHLNFKQPKFGGVSLKYFTVLGFLIAPFLWSLTPTFGRYPGMMPAADPSFIYNKSAAMQGPPGPSVSLDNRKRLFIYLKKHKPGSKILLAMGAAPEAAPYIIETGEAFVSMGGFQGRDPIFTESQLLEMVKNGELVYAMSMPRGGPRGGRGPGGPGGPGGGPPGNAVMNQFIETYGEAVDSKEWYLPDKTPVELPPDAPPFMRDMMRQSPTLYRLHPEPQPKKAVQEPPATDGKTEA